MRIASVLEDQSIEKRIAITPDVAKNICTLGFELSLQENYGVHLGINDDVFEKIGAKILKMKKKLINCDLIVQLGCYHRDKFSFKRKSNISWSFNPYNNKEKIESLVKKKINIFSLELLPRITRAQSMDILSSQANLAGYKAVIESFAKF